LAVWPTKDADPDGCESIGEKCVAVFCAVHESEVGRTRVGVVDAASIDVLAERVIGPEVIEDLPNVRVGEAAERHLDGPVL
jgi:hypothetical protein